MISVIIPTYNESMNVLVLIEKIQEVFFEKRITSFEILIMDDDSPDGTAGAVDALGDARVLAVNRKGRPRGLSAAVIDGFNQACGDILIVMDADLSHPPELLPVMIQTLEEGANIAVGSRYVPGGGSAHWPLKRVLSSKIACLMARPVTSVKDSTSGFFALKKSVLEGVKLNPLGFKIGLEVFARAKHENKIKEVPFIFTDRKQGKSKLRPAVMANYVKQLWLLVLRH